VKLWLKICGITSLKDAEDCSRAGVNALGFNFYRKSRRYIPPSTAARIIRRLDSGVIPVGVFVNETRDEIVKTIHETGIRMIQLSGDERPMECTGYTQEVIKAVRIRHRCDLEQVAAYGVNLVLLDGAPFGVFGGSGQLPDLEIARSLQKERRLVVAGGIGPENVATLLHQVHPYGIDVNSGVERSPGIKDREKVDRLCRIVKHLEE